MVDHQPPANNGRRRRPPPLQFRLRSVLLITVALSVLFGTLRWLGVSARASATVLALLTVSVLAAVGLLVAIAGWATGEHEGEEDD